MSGGKPEGAHQTHRVLQEILGEQQLQAARGQVLAPSPGVDDLRVGRPEQGLQVDGHGVEGKVPFPEITRQIRGPELGQVQVLTLPDYPGGAFSLIQQDKGAPQGGGQGPGHIQGLPADRQVQVVNLPAQEELPHRPPHQVDLEMPVGGQLRQDLQGPVPGQDPDPGG